jgi:hypothetical protein
MHGVKALHVGEAVETAKVCRRSGHRYKCEAQRQPCSQLAQGDSVVARHWPRLNNGPTASNLVLRSACPSFHLPVPAPHRVFFFFFFPMALLLMNFPAKSRG